jgi:hypothetical protein
VKEKDGNMLLVYTENNEQPGGHFQYHQQPAASTSNGRSNLPSLISFLSVFRRPSLLFLLPQPNDAPISNITFISRRLYLI